MIKLENIHKRFGETEVLKGIDLDIKQGEIIVIIGSSGTGKSTLLRTVNFLEQADEGRITIDDISVDTQKHTKAEVLALRRRTGFVFQNQCFIGTVGDTHAYWREGGPEFKNVNIMGVAHGTDKALVLEHKAAIDRHLIAQGIPLEYTNVFWGGRSEIKPSEISPFAYREWANEVGLSC